MNSRVYVLENSDSASLGAAFRAKHAQAIRAACLSSSSSSSSHRVRFHDVINDKKLELVAEPNPDAVEIYRRMLPRYRSLEDSIVAAEHTDP